MGLFNGPLCPICGMPLIEDVASGEVFCIECGYSEGDYGQDSVDYDPMLDW